MLLMWLFQFRSWDMVTPRYLALSTLSRTWPWRVYWDWRGCFDLVIWSNWHVLGLNSISQVLSHSCRVSRSTWRMFTSLNKLLSRQLCRRRTTLPVTVCFVAGRLCRTGKGEAKYRTLWHTRCHRYLWWPLPLQHYGLGSSQKECSNPV